MQTELIRLRGMPCKIQTTRPLVFRPYTVFPTVSGNEIPTRVTYGGHSKLTHQVNHIMPESFFIGCGMARFIDSAVYASAEMLHERSKQTIIDRRNHKIIVNHQACIACTGWLFHANSFQEKYNVVLLRKSDR